MTEFAFHENADDAIWRAIYPSISNPLRGGLKKLRIISTPNGLNNKFADLWLNSDPCLSASSVVQSPPSLYHKSKITIHDAIKHGLPLDANELRAGLNDEDAWSQEYLCEFMDTSSVMFPYDLIAPCESEQATETVASPFGVPPSGGSALYAGIDFGRKHHLTVCWLLERLPALGRTGRTGPSPHDSPMPNEICSMLNAQWIYVTREALCLKNTPTPEQLEILRPRLQRCRKICLDYTGAGIGLGDYLAQEFGRAGSPSAPSFTSLAPVGERAGVRGISPHSKLDLCSFTPALKAELFPRLRAAFEQRILRIPISREIREDLHAIQRTVTQNGQINYRAHGGRCGSHPDGHSDRTTALALALRAATSAPPSACATTISMPGRTADLRWARNLPRASRFRRRGFWF